MISTSTTSVSRYWPGVPNGDRITIEQLMTMHSGLYNYSRSRSLNRALDEHPRVGYRPQEMLKIAFAARRDPGFQTFVGHAPDTKATLVVWTNLNASPEGDAPATTIARDRIGRIYG